MRLREENGLNLGVRAHGIADIEVKRVKPYMAGPFNITSLIVDENRLGCVGSKHLKTQLVGTWIRLEDVRIGSVEYDVHLRKEIDVRSEVSSIEPIEFVAQYGEAHTAGGELVNRGFERLV